MRIAVLRCERLPAFVTWEIPDPEALFADDHRLIEALRSLGVDARPVVWSDPRVDWDRFDAAVVRSTWDYVDHLGEFLQVMTAIDRSRCTLLNPLTAIRWNADKRYLEDLDRSGVPIVPLVRGTRRDGRRLRAAVTDAGWEELVIKPTIGVGGAGVVRTDATGLGAALRELAPGVEVIVQPFADAIGSSGERSFVFFGDGLSHVLLKRPAPGDFRAHGNYGGTVEPAAPDAVEVDQVAAMRARLPHDLLYARFDVVPYAGGLAVLELELIEPMLYLDLAPGSADRLAEAAMARLRS